MRPSLLAQAVEARARRQPERPALVDTGERASWTYGALERYSRAGAHRLRGLGLEPGERVGVWMPKSAAAVGALLAVLRAGGVYVPLDPQAPVARIGQAAQDAGLRVLLAEPGWLEQAPQMGGPWARLPVSSAAPAWDEDSPPLPAPARTSEDLAYILYTSGSTGTPKGVMLSHAHALNFTEWAAEEFALSPRDRLASQAPFHFDLSVFDLWAGLAAGACVCLMDRAIATFPAALADWLEVQRITVWYTVPSTLVRLLPQLEAAPRGRWGGLRCLLFAGEPMPVRAAAAWRERLPQAVLANLFGPTETNVCAFYRLPLVPLPLPDPLPIGRPCPNFVLELRDETGRPVAEGEPGDLWARGPGVFAGYWGAASGDRSGYNTGDRVSRGPDGELYFHGRRDDLVKCRGYRIALGEVQAALLRYPGVRQAWVLARPEASRAEWLEAWVAGDPQRLELAELRAHCAAQLPAYMIPEHIEIRAGLPETSTGKIDRAAILAERKRIPSQGGAA